MKKIFGFFVVMLLSIATGMCGRLSAEEATPVEAGEAASVQGEVKATTPPEKKAHLLKNGDPIFMGDKIETGADGQLQVLLLDETVFTLGPSSAITVDEFVYDPGNASGKAGIVKGVFRAVAGKVSQKKQDDAAETEDLLDAMDAMDQASREAAQDRAHSSVGSAHR